MKRMIVVLSVIVASIMFSVVSYAENNDVYYIDFFKAIGTDVELKYDEEILNQGITRGEFVILAAQAINLNGSDYEQQYWDVKENLEYSNYITTMTQLNYVSGYGDGSFRPNSKISIDEAYTIAINILGYKVPQEESFGVNYATSLINELELNRNVEGQMNLRNTYKILYNMLNANAADVSYAGNLYKSSLGDTTLLKKLYKLDSSEGVYDGEWPWRLTKKQNLSSGQASVDGNIFESECSFKEDLGYKVKYFYNEEDLKLVFAYRIPKQESVRISAENIENYKDMTLYYYTENGSTKKIKLYPGTDYVYNGVGIDFSTEYSENLFDINDGYIEFVDNNGDGEYEVVFIVESFDMVVNTAYNRDGVQYITDKYYEEKNLVIDIYDDNIYKECIDSEDNECNLTDIYAGDILTVYKTLDGTAITIYVSTKKEEGIISAYRVNSYGGYSIIVDDKSYETTADYSEAILTGEDGIIYFDVNGKIAYISYVNIVDFVTGLTMNVTVDNQEEKVYLRVISNETPNKNSKVYECADRVSVDGVSIKNYMDIYEYITKLDASFPYVVRYAVNDDDKIVSLDTPHTGTREISDSIVYRNPNNRNLYCKATTRTLSGNYCYTKDTVTFSVPEDITDYSGYRMMTSSRLKNDEEMTIDVYSLGNEGFFATALVVQESSFGTSYQNICVVSKKYMGINEDDEVVGFLETYSEDTKDVSFVSKDNYSLIDDLDVGDIIRISKGANNEIEKIIKAYDYSEDKWCYSTDGITVLSNPTANYRENATIRVMLAKAYKISDEYVGLVDYSTDLSNISDSDIEAYKFSGVWYIYDVSRNKLDIRRAELEEIVEAKYNSQYGSSVMMQTEYNQPKVAYIIK